MHIKWGAVIILDGGMYLSPSPLLSFSLTHTEFIVQHSTVRFSDVGGCNDCLREVSKLLLHMKQPQLFVRLGVRPPQGFLLHGPPGCGKTLIANAIAGVSSFIFCRFMYVCMYVCMYTVGVYVGGVLECDQTPFQAN